MTGTSINLPYILNNLISLPIKEKIEIIAMLSKSLVEENQVSAKVDNWADSLYGAWKDDRSAEEIVADIRASRTSNRDVVSLFD